MRAFVSKSEIKGRIKAPSSKSYTIRGLMCAALAEGTSKIIHPLCADDTEVACDLLARIGVTINREADVWQVISRNLHKPTTELYCGESATTLRFMTALCSLVPGRCRLRSSPSLSLRPIEPLIEALKQLGVICSYHNGQASIFIEGGNLKGGTAELPGNISSQFVSALLLVSPLAEKKVKIRLTTPLESQPYVLMTLECLEKFGIEVKYTKDLREYEILRQAYSPAKYYVEGDWSSASYLLALGALSGELEVENLNPESLQGDKVILNFLQDMGAPVKVKKNSISIKQSRLKAIQANLANCIDLLPTIAVLAATADGVSQFVGIERARLKESNRVSAVREGLERIGIEVIEEKNRLTITGSKPIGAIIDSKGDHRIAMSFSLLGTLVGNTIIDGAECVSKTFPEFWEILKDVDGEVVYGE